MCHVVLMMPVLGLGVFWIWPLSVALPIYLVIFLLSGLVYSALLRASNHPVKTGREGLMQESAEVIEPVNPKGRIRVHGELWQAISSEDLRTGDRVKVVGVNGLTLRVQKMQDE